MLLCFAEMSTLPQNHDEDVQLGLIAGSGDTHNNTCNQVVICAEQGASSCCYDKNHRKLAIWSIICGLSCIGITALINSVKVFYCLPSLSQNIKD